MAHQIHLNENEIACALQCDLSEDGLDLDDDSLMDPDFEPDFEESIDESLEAEFDIDALVDTLNDDDRNSNFEVEVGPALSSSDIPGTSDPPVKRRKPEKLTLRWKKKNLELNAQQLAFTGNESLSSDILDLDTPIQFFLFLFPPELIKRISEETNLYVVQKRPKQHVSCIGDRNASIYRGSIYDVTDSATQSDQPLEFRLGYTCNSTDHAF
ncbi:unnamed protein product [Parnassius apollo]|uniref:(apollo) hypothetical protein n=1 Tax=Parnassius apollo TaxID=110799 RepID=A0A8S3W3H7_PARAO|nr:unnamed protein product [Parnassius apollo]